MLNPFIIISKFEKTWVIVFEISYQNISYNLFNLQLHLGIDWINDCMSKTRFLLSYEVNSIQQNYVQYKYRTVK